VETKWHDAILDLTPVLNGTVVLPQILADGALLGDSL
jgi:hypothetical protein